MRAVHHFCAYVSVSAKLGLGNKKGKVTGKKEQLAMISAFTPAV